MAARMAPCERGPASLLFAVAELPPPPLGEAAGAAELRALPTQPAAGFPRSVSHRSPVVHAPRGALSLRGAPTAGATVLIAAAVVAGRRRRRLRNIRARASAGVPGGPQKPGESPGDSPVGRGRRSGEDRQDPEEDAEEEEELEEDPGRFAYKKGTMGEEEEDYDEEFDSEMEGNWGDFRPGGAIHVLGQEEDRGLDSAPMVSDDMGPGGYPMGDDDFEDFEGMGPMGMNIGDYPMDDEEDFEAPPSGAYRDGDDAEEDDDEDWGDEDWDDDLQSMGFRYEDTKQGGVNVEKLSDVFDGMEEPGESPEKAAKKREKELNLLYDDFEVQDEEQEEEFLKRPAWEEEVMKRMQEEDEALVRHTSKTINGMEEREYVVTAEGIAVRTLPDERSPQTGEILRQGEEFLAIETRDGENRDQRIYLKLPDGRGWVFDDSRIYPGFPSVKLVKDTSPDAFGRDDEPKPVLRPRIAVVGRPNVGKSSLVNRICDLHLQEQQMTWDARGVTRDRAYKEAEHTDRHGNTYLFEVIDTGGMIYADDIESARYKDEIQHQIDVALYESVACIMVVDSRSGVTIEDELVANYLKENYVSKGMKVVVAVAKCDLIASMDLKCTEFWSLGLGQPIACTSLHGRGIWEICEEAVQQGLGGLFPRRERGKMPPPTLRERATAISIIGLPNVGKSTLFNALVGESRSIVSGVAGTTTDIVDAYLESEEGKVYRFVDTAGIRSKRRRDQRYEWIAAFRALKAVTRSDVALFCLDATRIYSDRLDMDFWRPTTQERHIARSIEARGTACVVVLTKWDKVPLKDHATQAAFVRSIRSNLAGIGQWAEVMTCSALTGQRLKKIFEVVDKTLEAHEKQVPTSVLNQVVRDALLWRLPAMTRHKAKQGRIYYAAQTAVSPPQIILFCNDPRLFRENYKTYLENKLRQDLAWFGTPIRIEYRASPERKQRKELKKWLGPRLQPEQAEMFR